MGAAEATQRALRRCDGMTAGADALRAVIELDDATRGPSLVVAEIIGVLNRLEARYARLDSDTRKELWSAARGSVVREVLVWAAPRFDGLAEVLTAGWSRRRGEAAPDAWRAACGACALVYAAAEARGCERVLGDGVIEREDRSLIGGGVVLQAALRVAKRTKGTAARAQLKEDLKLDPAVLGEDAAAALLKRAAAFLRRVADLARDAFRRSSRRADALGDAWLEGFLAEARDALPRAALHMLRAPLATFVVEDALKRRPQKLLAARVAAARRVFAGVDDAAAATLAGLEALSALDRPRRLTLTTALRGLVDTERHDSLEVAVAVADETVRRQLHGMLEANGVRGLDDVAAARFLEACAS